MTKNPFWRDRHAGDSIRFLDQVYTLKASGYQTGGSFGLVEVSTPEGSGPPPHVHEREDELFYLLEGTYEVTVGEERFQAAGRSIFAPRGIPHGYVVRAGPARHLGFVFPSGWKTFFHDFVRSMGESPSNPETLARMAKERGHPARPSSRDRRCVPDEDSG